MSLYCDCIHSIGGFRLVRVGPKTFFGPSGVKINANDCLLKHFKFSTIRGGMERGNPPRPPLHSVNKNKKLGSSRPVKI